MKTKTPSRQSMHHFPRPRLTLTSTSLLRHHLRTTLLPYLRPLRTSRFKHPHSELAFLLKALAIAPALQRPRATFVVFEIIGYTREKMWTFWCVLLAPRITFVVSLTSCLVRTHVDHECAEDEREFNFAIHNLCHPFGCKFLAEDPERILTFCSQNAEARHRYSEFESLRSNLTKLYPTLIIPPIPSKQSISDYAIKQAKAREDVAMIARRKRMLQTFLNRIARHPILSNEHVFHRFLQGEVSWVCTHFFLT